MKCTNCNAENANDALFCMECGTRFTSPVPEQVPASEDLSATPSDAPEDVLSEAAGQDSGLLDAPVEDDLEIPEDAPSPFAPSSDAPAETEAVVPAAPVFAPSDNAAPAFPESGFQQPPQPAFTPVPQPVAPVAPVDNNKAPGEKKDKKFFVPMIIFIVLFALAAAGLGVGAYLYMKQKSDLNTKIEDRDKTIDEKDDEISDLEEQVTELSDENGTLENDKIQLNADISNLKSEVEKLTDDVKTAQKEKEDFKNLLDLNSKQLNEVYNSITKLAPPTESLFASKNVVILKPGTSQTITVSKRHSGSFNITSSANNKLISTQFGANNEWKNDGTLHTNSFTITAGNAVGQTVITFTTNVDAESFQILVIIAE